jgi:hypothetical protein
MTIQRDVAFEATASEVVACHTDVATDEVRKASRARAPDSPAQGEYRNVRTARPDEEQAQARALIRVLKNYKLDREWGGPTLLWRELEAFGHGGGAVSLQGIGRDHGGTASAAFSAGIKNRVPHAALYLALASFTRASPAYRFLDVSRWIALTFAFKDGEAVADINVQREVLERLEAAFEEEMGAEAAV